MTDVDRGYSIRDQVFERSEMTRTLEALARARMDRTKAGARHVLAVPIVRDLAGDRRLLAVAAVFLGTTPIPFRATLFEKSWRSNWLVAWHQDTALPIRRRVDDAEWGPWSTKAGVLHAHAPAWALEQVVALRVSLDDSTLSNGPLRVLPDTHRQGVLTVEEIGQLGRETNPVDCVAASGGVVALRPLTVHASSKSTDDRPRRVLHIEYASATHLRSGVELAIG